MNTKLFFSICFLTFGLLKAQIITTIAGTPNTNGYTGDGGLATNAKLNFPSNVAIDVVGNVFIADFYNDAIRKINTSGIITTIAGNGTIGYSGDGGPSTAATLDGPYGLRFDSGGNLYIAEYYNNVIRQINTMGIINTVAGGGSVLGDGGNATLASLSEPRDVAFDNLGNMYIADVGHNRIRKVNTAGTISTIAGNGTGGYTGDGGQATAAEIYGPIGIVLDASGNLFLTSINSTIRKINTAGIITTIAGNGTSGYTGDGGLATLAELGKPQGINIDALGNIYFADIKNWVIREINTSGIISTVAGNGIRGGIGDGGLATAAEFWGPTGVAFDAFGNLYITDANATTIRKVCYNSGSCSTTGIKQYVSNNEVSIYPNPSNGNINLISTNNIDEIKVNDMLGQMIYEVKPHSASTTLVLENSGVYFVTITSGTETTTKKVIVNK